MQYVLTFLGGLKLKATTRIATISRQSSNNRNNFAIKKNISKNKIKQLVKKCKMKLLLDLHNARPAPTEPWCRPV
jgi:hypothetical protein